MDLRRMLCLYPCAWRARYEDEMRAVLEQRPATIAAGVDLLLGALDAHLERRRPSSRTSACWPPP